MPALVPPGFTRGPILFLGSAANQPIDARLLQRFWTEAGSYGARILIVPTAASQAAADPYVQLFTQWEAGAINVLTVQNRPEAQQAHHLALIDQATAILILDGNPLRFASILGGTPVAQAIRRANARGKIVASIGRGGAILCQHMLVFEPSPADPEPFLHRRLIQFAPGLGIINRLVLDVTNGAEGLQAGLGRLLTAVAYNPFLVGVNLEAGAGVAIYAESTLEVFGAGSVLLVDGAGISYTNVHEYEREEPLSLIGVQLHVLARGYTFNFDQRTVHPPVSSDIPMTVMPEQNTSSF